MARTFPRHASCLLRFNRTTSEHPLCRVLRRAKSPEKTLATGPTIPYPTLPYPKFQTLPYPRYHTLTINPKARCTLSYLYLTRNCHVSSPCPSNDRLLHRDLDSMYHVPCIRLFDTSLLVSGLLPEWFECSIEFQVPTDLPATCPSQADHRSNRKKTSPTRITQHLFCSIFSSSFSFFLFTVT